jgi:hypothetical protein
MNLIKPFYAAMTLTWKALFQRSRSICLTFVFVFQVLAYASLVLGNSANALAHPNLSSPTPKMQKAPVITNEGFAYLIFNPPAYLNTSKQMFLRSEERMLKQ